MEATPKRVLINKVDITDFSPEQLRLFYMYSSEEVRALIRAWMAFRNANPEMAQALLDSETIVNIKWGTLDDRLPSLTSVDDEGNIQLTINSNLKDANEWYIEQQLGGRANEVQISITNAFDWFWAIPRYIAGVVEVILGAIIGAIGIGIIGTFGWNIFGLMAGGPTTYWGIQGILDGLKKCGVNTPDLPDLP